jgi:hexosaminidase
MELPLLIPTPAEIHFESGDAFMLDAATPIQVGPSAGQETLFAARQLQEAVHDVTGLSLPLRKSPAPEEGSRRMALVLASGEAAADRDLGPEGYALAVVPHGITIRASDDAGLFYGVQTLRQLMTTYGARVPALTIRDRPALAHRGLMLDVSRGKVPTLDTLFKLVDGLSAYKYNQLQLYVEHTFDFPSHPDIGADTDPLTADDILALDAYCQARHIELVPNLQSFGHQRHMLSMPRYGDLDEVGWRWSLTPARDETYHLLDELYADFLPAFSSSRLNVDCDETWDLGTGQSKALAAELGKGRLYLQHILRLRGLAAKHGRRIMLWADVLHHYPELVPELPDDVLLLDWEYESAHHYPTTETLGKSGRAFWVCPGTSSWNTLFPRLDNALGNIRNYVRDGLAAGATGMLLTDWGDYGHYQALSLSWYPYLFGAATAWTGAQTSPEEFDAAFATQFLQRAPDDAALSAMRRLGKAVTAPTLGLRNRSAIALALFDDPLGGARTAETDPRALVEAESAAHELIAASASLADPALRYDYGFTARLVAFAAAKALAAQKFRESPAALPDAVATLTAQRATAAALRTEFESCWLRHARRSEIHLTLEHFDALDQSYADGLAWLNERGADANLSTYTPRPFAILWEQGQAELRDLARRAGDETLPEHIRAWVQQIERPAIS